MTLFSFGCSNATITKWYKSESLSKYSVGGGPILSTYTTVSKRVWLTINNQELRQIEGDNYSVGASVVGGLLEGLSEGDILEITQDTVGSETAGETNKWRVESLNIINSVSFVYHRSRRMELNLTIYS